MANFIDLKDRRVVPNWRSFGTTTVLGELNSFQIDRPYALLEPHIDEYVIDWQLNRNTIHAADLLSAAIVNNKKDNPVVKEAAVFILENKDKATFSQIDLAESIINKDMQIDIMSEFELININNINGLIDKEPIIKKIRGIKDTLSRYTYNPVLFVELSRYYSILGQEEKAVNSMKVALHLAPENRFVLRSATRLFLHYQEEDNDYAEYIHNILRTSPVTAYDPWLTSAEISVATVRDRSSRFIKKGIELINSKNIAPFNFTELASSIGTVELMHGSTKKSRDFFNKSLIRPNDNSLAQIEWATTTDNQLNIDTTGVKVEMDFEANALDNYRKENFDEALVSALRWFADMPFSKRPILFASNLASTVMKDQPKAIAFLSEGLKSHPNDPVLINNLAYSLALENKTEEAFEALSRLKGAHIASDTTKICLTATMGLAYFRQGFFDLGRQFYLDAIEETKHLNYRELNWIAILNYAREELLAGTEDINHIYPIFDKIPKDYSDIEIRALRKDVEDLLEARREQ